MKYIDTHCHVYSSSCEDVKKTVDEALASGVCKMINCSENINISREIIELSKKYKNILFATIGIHPEYASSYNKEDLNELEKMIRNNKVVAIGEIGLDYHYGIEDKDIQKVLFNDQLVLAEKFKLPVIIHSRDATKDTIDILKQHNVTGIIHSFSGSYETGMEYIKMGFKLGINGVITFKNSNLKDTVYKIGIENIVLETDSPFLTPHPFRGKTNSPKNVVIIGKYISDLFSLTEEEVGEITSKNAYSIFDI